MKIKIGFLAVVLCLITSLSFAATWPDFAGLHQDYIAKYAAQLTSSSQCGEPGQFNGAGQDCFYYTSYYIDSMAHAVERSGNAAEMAQLNTLAMNMVNYAVKQPNGHLQWPPVNASYQPLTQLSQFKGSEALAKVASVINNNATFKASYGATATAIINFIQDSVFQFWHTETYGGVIQYIPGNLGGNGSYTYWVDNTNLFGAIAAHMYTATRDNPINPTNTAMYLDVARKIGTALKRTLTVSDAAWVLDNTVSIESGNTSNGWDTAHFTDVVRLMTALYEGNFQSMDAAQAIFSAADMTRLANTLTGVIWDGNNSPTKFRNYINGGNGNYRTSGPFQAGTIYPGWTLTGKYSATALSTNLNLLNSMINGTDVGGNTSSHGFVAQSGYQVWAAGAVSQVATVTWTNDRGGAQDVAGQAGPSSGSGGIIGSNWTISNIPLSAGINNLVVTYTDTAGVQTTDNLVVTYAPTFLGNTLAGAWSFDNVATDSSGNVPPNNATLLNGATYAPGKFGQALFLDGVDDSALVNDANTLDFTQSFTFSAWLFPTAIQTGWTAAIVKNYMIGLYTASPNCGAGTPVIWFRANGISGPNYYACYAQPLPPNQWTHLAGTYDGSNLRLYTDGVLRTTTAASGYIEPSALSMQIGASQFGEYFQGRIDEARVYNWGIPLTAGSNTTPGAACTQQNYADNTSNPSIIGNMNCGIVQVTTPVTIKFPASATSLKVGAAPGAVKFGQAGQ